MVQRRNKQMSVKLQYSVLSELSTHYQTSELEIRNANHNKIGP